MIEVIDETTVGFLGEERVPMANVMRGEYALPDGTLVQGDVCLLILPDPAGDVVVGVGSEVSVSGVRWRVLSVDNPADELGSVTLERLG